MSAPQSENQLAPATDTPPKQKKARLVFLLLLVGIGAGLGYKWWNGLHYVSTDNAQVDGQLLPILPKVGGYVTEIPVQDNQRVVAGALLARLDDRDYRAKLAQAEAELATARAAAGKDGQAGQAAAQVSVASASAAAAQSSAAAAQAALQQALANLDRAKNDYDRTDKLVAQKMVSAQQLDAAAAALKAARAQVDAARAQAGAASDSARAAGQQVTASTAGLKAAQARVAAAQAARDLAALQLSYTEVRAPRAGQVSKKAIEIGQLLQPGQQAMVLVPMDDIWVVANFKETDVGRIRAGQAVEIEVDAYPGKTFGGKVESLSAATGAKFSLLPPDNATGNFTKVVQRVPVKIRLDRFDGNATPLRAGMSVQATVRVG